MTDPIQRQISRALGSIRSAFRAVLTLVESGAGVQLAQADGLAGEPVQAAEVFQHYGLTSNPPAGSMAVVLPLGGKTSHGIDAVLFVMGRRFSGGRGQARQTTLTLKEDGAWVLDAHPHKNRHRVGRNYAAAQIVDASYGAER